MSLANLGEPATFVRSPMRMNVPSCCVKGWEPLRRSGTKAVGSGDPPGGTGFAIGVAATVRSREADAGTWVPAWFLFPLENSACDLTVAATLNTRGSGDPT